MLTINMLWFNETLNVQQLVNQLHQSHVQWQIRIWMKTWKRQLESLSIILICLIECLTHKFSMNKMSKEIFKQTNSYKTNNYKTWRDNSKSKL